MSCAACSTFAAGTKKKSSVGRASGSIGTRSPNRATPLVENAKDAHYEVIQTNRRCSTKRLLLEELAPAAVLINRSCEILYFTGPTSRYLELPSGAPTRDLLGLLREGLRGQLRAGISRAVRDGQRVVLKKLPFKRDGEYFSMTAAVVPVRYPAEASGLLLVTFSEGGEAAEEPLETPQGQSIVNQLELELRSTRDDLQTTIEQLENSNEELKASNEEAISMNEELQSTNEELETSREELESLNEELGAVNEQLQDKIGELETASNDLANFLNCTDIPTVFLDGKLEIRRFTPAAVRAFRLLAADVGRPISDIAPRFADEALLADAREVIEHLIPSEKTVQMHAGGWFLRRIMLYRTSNNRIDGVVVTFHDVTQLKQVQEQLQEFNQDLEQRVNERAADLKVANTVLQQEVIERRKAEAALVESRERLRALVDSAADGVITYNEQGIIEFMNPAAEQMFQYKAEELVGRHLKLLLPAPGSEADYPAEFLKSGLGQPLGTSRELEGQRRDGSRFPLELAIGEIRQLKLVTGILHDVSRRKELERDVVEAASQEQQRIAQDLHDSIGQNLTALGLLARDLAETLETDRSDRAELATKIAQGVQRTLQEVRAVTRGLNPVQPDAHGLMAALTDLVDRVGHQSRVDCRFDCPEPILLDDNTVATQFYRIAQEALSNALKHGAPTQITISLTRVGETIALRIEDNGKGIESPVPDDHGFGLRIMHNRAAVIGASLTVLPGASGGTIVTCLLPQKQHAKDQEKGRAASPRPDRR